MVQFVSLPVVISALVSISAGPGVKIHRWGRLGRRGPATQDLDGRVRLGKKLHFSATPGEKRGSKRDGNHRRWLLFGKLSSRRNFGLGIIFNPQRVDCLGLAAAISLASTVDQQCLG